MSGTVLEVPDAVAMRALGGRLAGLLGAGDLVVLAGDLGAGKTTLVQGLGQAMGVRGQVASPTFIIARVHPAVRGGPDLVHVDAYRLASLAEVDDLDLDTSVAASVTVVEWGRGKVEVLAEDRLEIEIRRPHGARATGGLAPDVADLTSDAPRLVTVRGVGARWAEADLAALEEPA
ncbi:tRNA (adenosine(37)-N6)-threonylcarbamoyltransferase complex ATPase subunit type 1 TsaE [Georgenia sp. 10Sc9-8]|uniref:tRNA threonylcarbamoyladenosine biosynthesis protein TsaE n=1 Tax=Georgenia halotolerans TaxID=3028317 RepID=A0ABT5U191_9MICO|nr:tRNA (adenosine(37)-N6)-threonylcarbamoyltransferase complex ATPase subunit type 1 TsaE [Georgenia halotolerans]